MVLGLRLIHAVLALHLACPAGAAQHEQTGDGVVIDGVALRLFERDAVCLVERSGEIHALGLPAPCRFLRRGAAAEPAVHAYGERGTIVLVAGPLAHPDDYSRSDYLSPRDRCSHLARGVVVRKGVLSITALFSSPLGYCAELAPDEKFYYGIVHAAE